MEPLMLVFIFEDNIFLDTSRDQFIDEYLETHPDATEFEAALMWTIEIEQEEPRL